jgi:hypothetical protein
LKLQQQALLLLLPLLPPALLLLPALSVLPLTVLLQPLAGSCRQ